MIQRIQTIYMAIACVLCILCLVSDLGRFVVAGTEAASFSNFSFSVVEGSPLAQMTESGPWGMSILLFIVIFLTIIAIMLFRKRMRQVRLLSLSSILLVGYLITYAFLAWVYDAKVEDAMKGADYVFQITAGTIYPVICLILNGMAIHFIKKDEALVRSLDRLR